MDTNATPTPKGGPRTEAGKATSSLNALTHGLLSNVTLIDGEDPLMLKSLRKSFLAEMAPVGALEEFLTERLVVDAWRLRRALATEGAAAEHTRESIEGDLFATSTHGSQRGVELAVQIAPATSSDSEKIVRYLASIERSFFRTLHELQRLQSARHGEAITPPAVLDVNLNGEDKG